MKFYSSVKYCSHLYQSAIHFDSEFTDIVNADFNKVNVIVNQFFTNF